MTPIFPELPVELGMYTLTRLLASHAMYDRYIARQTHVERAVIIEVMRPNLPPECVSAFLNNARAKVAARIPNVTRVLESMVSGNLWYTTMESPAGTPLSRMAAKGKHLSIKQGCAIIQKVAQLYEDCALRKLAAGPLDADSIFLKGDDQVYFLSPVVEGEYNPQLLGMQLDGLVSAIIPVMPEGVQGQKRFSDLVRGIGSQFDGKRMQWQAIAAATEYILPQVTPLANSITAPPQKIESEATKRRRAERKKRAIVKGGLLSVAAMAIIGGMGYLGSYLGSLVPPEQLPLVKNGRIFCKYGNRTYSVMASPVSISAYDKFLTEYDKLPTLKRYAINKGMPSTAASHTPLEWEAQLEAATKGTMWRGQKLKKNSPVRGVSYWDALAYARYKTGKLPDVNVLAAVQEETDSNAIDEWTDTERPKDDLYNKATIILRAKNNPNPILETDYEARDPRRGFRLAYPRRFPHSS